MRDNHDPWDELHRFNIGERAWHREVKRALFWQRFETFATVGLFTMLVVFTIIAIFVWQT